MSRYYISDYVYGFDNPLSEYFMQKKGTTIVGTMSEPKVYGSASNLYEALLKEGLLDKIPTEHRNAILGDLPF